MKNASETREKVIEIQVALDKAILDKQNAETEAAMVKEKAESYKAEIKRLELMVCSIIVLWLYDDKSLFHFSPV